MSAPVILTEKLRRPEPAGRGAAALRRRRRAGRAALEPGRPGRDDRTADREPESRAASASLIAPALEFRKQALGITDNLVRISIGVEDADDLIADFEQALAAI